MTRHAPGREMFEARLRQIGDERYHDKHPFHQLLHSGGCTEDQVRAWVINRYYYQSRIPMKDAAFMSRVSDPALRRSWRSRIEDHDGTEPGTGGISRWLKLAEGVGLDPEAEDIARRLTRHDAYPQGHLQGSHRTVYLKSSANLVAVE